MNVKHSGIVLSSQQPWNELDGVNEIAHPECSNGQTLWMTTFNLPASMSSEILVNCLAFGFTNVSVYLQGLQVSLSLMIILGDKIKRLLLACLLLMLMTLKFRTHSRIYNSGMDSGVTLLLNLHRQVGTHDLSVHFLPSSIRPWSVPEFRI